MGKKNDKLNSKKSLIVRKGVLEEKRDTYQWRLDAVTGELETIEDKLKELE